MKTKSELKKKIAASRPQKRAPQNEGGETEFIWVQSSDFFKNVESQTSTESTSINQFNSEF